MTILVQKPYKMGEVEILQDWANIIVVLKGNSGLSERGRLRPRDFVTLRAAASGIPSVEGGAWEGEPRMNIALLFRIDKTSLGVSRIGVATPRDDCPYAKSNDNTLALARAYRVFLTSCVGINLGDIPRGLRHPRDVPSVDPSTLGQKPYTNSLRSCIVPMNMEDEENLLAMMTSMEQS